MSVSQGKILVIRGGAIGDFVLTLPVLSALRDMFPRTRIEVLGYPHIVQIAEVGGLVDRAHPIDARPLASFFAHNGDLDPAQSAFFEEFDIIVSYLYDPDHFFQDNVSRCSVAQFHAGPHRPDDDGGCHATQTFLKPLERLAIFDADTTPRIEVAPWEDEPGGLEFSEDRTWLAVHPGSGSERKNWPEARWGELLGRIIETTDVNLLVVGGESEGEKLARLASGFPAERHHVLRSRPLGELSRCLARCDGFVGHDSGVTHLAAAVGLPGIALWGDTAFDVWGPRSEAIETLRHENGLDGLSVDAVNAAVEKMLATLADQAV